MDKIIFKAGHDRDGAIWLENSTCDRCKQDKLCLLIDSSEDECGPGAICKDCIETLFKENQKSTTTH